jgi:hypothetical protein
MDRLLFAILCQYSGDPETMAKCQAAFKTTLVQFQIYQTIKEKEKYYRLFAEEKISKQGVWILTTAIAAATSQSATLTGHNIMGIDSVNLKLGREAEISLSWSF